MKKLLIIGLILSATMGCREKEKETAEAAPKDSKASEASPQGAETTSSEDPEVTAGTDTTANTPSEYVNGYRSVTWWDLLSDEEFNYYKEINAEYEKDSAYMPATGPPEPGINSRIDGKKIRIPGFIVGVDTDPEDFSKVDSFLLVPYQGACIHVPPPPPNQVVFTNIKESLETNPYRGYWLCGTIHIERGSNDIASFFYSMTGDKVEPYY